MSSSGFSVETLIRFMTPSEDNSINLDDVMKKLHLDQSKLDLDKYYIEVIGSKEDYTILQFATKYGRNDFVKVLLSNNVDPNSTGGDEHKRKNIYTTLMKPNKSPNRPTIKFNCQAYPVLLAAEYGRHEILKMFKFHNSACNRENSEFGRTSESSDNDCKINLRKISKPNTNVNFQVSSRKGNVLHLVLKQPLLEGDCYKEMRNVTNAGTSTQASPATQSMKDKSTLRRIANDYRKCIKILLSTERCKDVIQLPCSYPKQIRAIMNEKDRFGNTPLHYAVLNWCSITIEHLLSLGANAGIKNHKNEIPLSRISRSTFENFLNRKCIIVEGINACDDESNEDTEEDDDSDEAMQDCNQLLTMKINRCGTEEGNKITFDYAFLAPPRITSNSRFYADSESHSKKKGSEREDDKAEQNGKSCYQSEMDLLTEMCDSTEHRSLVAHPVIESYLWMKSKLISTFFHRTIRLRLLFLVCVIWYIFMQFGGYKWIDNDFMAK